jgi:hypothetical protein
MIKDLKETLDKRNNGEKNMKNKNFERMRESFKQAIEIKKDNEVKTMRKPSSHTSKFGPDCWRKYQGRGTLGTRTPAT